MESGSWMTVRAAWEGALYGSNGFYRSEQPAHHFRTSAHASALFADAVLTLIRHERLEAVVELGAGGGELLGRLAALAPELHMTGIDIRGRPDALPEQVTWRAVDPSRDIAIDADASRPTLLLANELLDNVPCDVVEVDQGGEVRIVEVDVESGAFRLGSPSSGKQRAWLDEWWPLSEPGQRADVGDTRDSAWGRACEQVPVGLCLAIDYGHLRARRPGGSTLTSFRAGRQYAPSFDGRHDVTAHVAVDAVAAAAHAEVHSQRSMLRSLGVAGNRPDVARASTAPTDYLRELAKASQAGELTASPGLGDFSWMVTRRDRTSRRDGIMSATRR